VVIPLAGHWVWFGWLKERGFIDVGGASVIHLSAAVCAAIGAALVGPRMGKYNKDGSSNSVPGHALPLTSIGTLMLLVAWFPYLIGCVLAHDSSGDLSTVGFGAVGMTATNIMLAAAGGALAGMIYGQFRYRKPDVSFTYIGLMGALVAISAGAAGMGNVGALITGAIAGLIVPLLTFEIDMRWHLDDPLGVAAIHGVGGLWGVFAAALFASGTVSERLKLLGVQALGAAAIIALAAVVSLVVFLALKATLGLRVNDSDEFDGLDLGEHDINAYPDFQQTTIKSYHLREA
ncbi:MAG TPA: hypothetical protein VLI90_13785, partial [Tepidisphaeraceae bacterium]|nr:hypothetical protein [Tepidisphaeraceae bacterium]